jgi:hypothetical protein
MWGQVMIATNFKLQYLELASTAANTEVKEQE